MTTTSPKKTAVAKKAPAKKPAAKSAEETTAHKTAGAYFYALGRRKRSVAQVRLFPTGKGKVTVNGIPANEYFPVFAYQTALVAPLKTVGLEDADMDIKVSGGGKRGQSDAVMLGAARALLELNPDFRAPLKAEGYLTRDPREKERKHFGFKKARKASQWAKR